MPPVIFILAAGHQDRMTGRLDYPKGFLRVGGDGESIVARTVRLARACGAAEILLVVSSISSSVVTSAAYLRLGITHVIPPEDDCARVSVLDRVRGLLDGWRGSEPDPFVFLLGDVVYSAATLARVLATTRLALVGRRGPNPVTGKASGEVYALVVPARAVPAAVNLIDLMRLLSPPPPVPKLWDLAAALGTPHFLAVPEDDFTDDVDTEWDLQNVLPRLREAVCDEERQKDHP